MHRRDRGTARATAVIAFGLLVVLVAVACEHRDLPRTATTAGASRADDTGDTTSSTSVPALAPASSAVAPTRVDAARTQQPTSTTSAVPLSPGQARVELDARSVAGGPAIVPSAPDPMLLAVEGSWYLYATGQRGSLLQVWRSIDLVSWQRLDAPLAALPPWSSAQPQWTCAPAVTRLDDGTYALYYATRHAATKAQCISVATAHQPAGPFIDRTTEPLVCQYSLGGSIDPSVFVDADGARTLLWKNDGNCCAQRTLLWSQTLAADGLSLEGRAAPLLGDDQAWEGGIVEAPSMWLLDGVYHLLYSANRWDTDRYGIGQATCASALGPCEKLEADEPSITGRGSAVAPGGAEFVAIDGGLWIVHHTWAAGRVGVGGRSVLLTRLARAEDGTLHIA